MVKREAARRPAARQTARISAEEAARLLAGPAATIAPLTIAAGDEAFLRDRTVAAFRAGAEAERSEFLRVEGEDLTGSELAGALASISLFGDLRRIWIREGAKMERAAETALLEWADGAGEGVRVLLTTAREVADLSGLSALAEKGTVVACTGGPAETRRWAERLALEAGLRLPGGALEALATRVPDLLSLSREIEKLSLLRNADGTIAPSSLGVLAGARGSASATRWAAAVLAGDEKATRGEAAALDVEGIGGSACLWAVAERALSALEPQGYGFRRDRSSGGPPLSAADARRALHAVYRADLALKRGEVRDQELRDFVEREIARVDHA